MRTKLSKFLISCILLLLAGIMLVTFLLPIAQNASALSCSAKGACVMETSTHRVLFQNNKDVKLPMASTTKIMTAITAIENCQDLDEKFVISPKAIGVEGTSLYLREGDTYSTRELLYALMLISGNDASVAIAEHVGGSTSEFVTKMNELAKKIGTTNTHFANTHGLDADGHYTTAYDLALITSYALENETFRQIVSTKNTKIENGKDNSFRYLKNKNKLLNTLQGCIGVKTGYTSKAGRCLVSAVERDGMRLVCVVLNCGPMFEESGELLDELSKKYKLVDVTKLYNYQTTVAVEDGKYENAEIGTYESYLYPLTEAEKERLSFEVEAPTALKAPMNKNEIVGEIKVFLDNDLLFSEKIYTIEQIKPKSFMQRLKDFAKNW